jgi:hypothetical protein
MTREDAALVRALLTTPRHLALGVLVDGAPYVGLLPFAASPGLDGAWVHASRLARHTRGLGPGALYSALVHLGAPDVDPLQVPRLTLLGVVEPLPREGPDHLAARAAYLARIPAAEPLFALGDFELYFLSFRSGRLIAGFAQARDVSPADLAEAAQRG